MKGFFRVLVSFLLALTIWLGFSLLVGYLSAGLPEKIAVYTGGYLSTIGLFVAIGLAGRSRIIKR